MERDSPAALDEQLTNQENAALISAANSQVDLQESTGGASSTTATASVDWFPFATNEHQLAWLRLAAEQQLVATTCAAERKPTQQQQLICSDPNCSFWQRVSVAMGAPSPAQVQSSPPLAQQQQVAGLPSAPRLSFARRNSSFVPPLGASPLGGSRLALEASQSTTPGGGREAAPSGRRKSSLAIAVEASPAPQQIGAAEKRAIELVGGGRQTAGQTTASSLNCCSEQMRSASDQQLVAISVTDTCAMRAAAANNNNNNKVSADENDENYADDDDNNNNLSASGERDSLINDAAKAVGRGERPASAEPQLQRVPGADCGDEPLLAAAASCGAAPAAATAQLCFSASATGSGRPLRHHSVNERPQQLHLAPSFLVQPLRPNQRRPGAHSPSRFNFGG